MVCCITSELRTVQVMPVSSALEKGLLCVSSMQELKVCLDYALLVFLVIKTFMVPVILSIRYLKQ